MKTQQRRDIFQQLLWQTQGRQQSVGGVLLLRFHQKKKRKPNTTAHQNTQVRPVQQVVMQDNKCSFRCTLADDRFLGLMAILILGSE